MDGQLSGSPLLLMRAHTGSKLIFLDVSIGTRPLSSLGDNSVDIPRKLSPPRFDVFDYGRGRVPLGPNKHQEAVLPSTHLAPGRYHKLVQDGRLFDNFQP